MEGGTFCFDISELEFPGCPVESLKRQFKVLVGIKMEEEKTEHVRVKE